MSLEITPVYRNLHARVSLLGLELEDLIAVLVLAAMMNLAAHLVGPHATVLGMPLNLFMELGVPALAVPSLILFKYGRPRGYLEDLLRSLLAPRAWCALEADPELTGPYLVDEDPREAACR